jgi:hypothetical protein
MSNPYPPCDSQPAYQIQPQSWWLSWSVFTIVPRSMSTTGSVAAADGAACGVTHRADRMALQPAVSTAQSVTTAATAARRMGSLRSGCLAP